MLTQKEWLNLDGAVNEAREMVETEELNLELADREYQRAEGLVEDVQFESLTDLEVKHRLEDFERAERNYDEANEAVDNAKEHLATMLENYGDALVQHGPLSTI